MFLHSILRPKFDRETEKQTDDELPKNVHLLQLVIQLS